MDLSENLKKLFANIFAMYLQAHNYHLNVEGMFFESLHSFFGKIYKNVFESVDSVAEQLRVMGEYAPASMSQLLELMSFEEETTNQFSDTKEMLKRLSAVNDMVRASLYITHTSANERSEFGLINFLEERIAYHDQLSWQLKSHLKTFEEHESV